MHRQQFIVMSNWAALNGMKCVSHCYSFIPISVTTLLPSYFLSQCTMPVNQTQWREVIYVTLSW